MPRFVALGTLAVPPAFLTPVVGALDPATENPPPAAEAEAAWLVVAVFFMFADAFDRAFS